MSAACECSPYYAISAHPRSPEPPSDLANGRISLTIRGIILFTHSRRGDHRSDQRAPPSPRPGTGSAPQPAQRTGPGPQRPSTPAATSAARHPHRRRTRGPRPTSGGRPRTRTRGPATDGTDASHEQFAAQQRHQAQSQANANAVCESFFASLKKELVNRRPWPTRAEARSNVFEYIEGWYNPRRRHSTLGYLSPADYEQQHRQDNTAPALAAV